jgi:MFS transporter, MHS family, proline/betaine transporter
VPGQYVFILLTFIVVIFYRLRLIIAAEQVIHHNFFVSIIETIAILPLIYLCRYLYPILILKIKLVAFVIFILICPYLFNNATSEYHIFFIQSFIMLFVLDDVPATTIFVIYFPVFKRFTSVATIYAMSRTIMYVITSFWIIYLTKYFGNYGLFIIIIPVIIGYTFGLFYFEKLEKESGNHPDNMKDLEPQVGENAA